jgi:hypothetical protein
LPQDFVSGSTGVFINNATRGTFLSSSRDFTPPVNVPVKFVIPKLPIRKTCGAEYKIGVKEMATGRVVYENEDSFNEFSYTFTDCTKTYELILLASAKKPGALEGNCSRSIRVTVKPQCNTAVCNCDPVKPRPTGYSSNFNVEGKVLCLSPTDRLRRYSIQYSFVNKSNCNLVIESVTILGQSLGSNSVTIPAGGRSANFNMGFSTPLTQAPPAEGSVNILVQYKLNDKSCSTTIKMPYTPCN